MLSHESEALEYKQKLQMKTFSDLAECLARIPPQITLYGILSEEIMGISIKGASIFEHSSIGISEGPLANRKPQNGT